MELQHAVIEYSDSEYCFVLQDLNTAHGTYVNDCRVQNAAVRLAPGDIIRFGYSGIPMELDVEDAPMVRNGQINLEKLNEDLDLLQNIWAILPSIVVRWPHGSRFKLW